MSGSENTEVRSIWIASEPGVRVRSFSAFATVGAPLRFAWATSNALTAGGAMAMPAPESRSAPVASMSSAMLAIAVRSCAWVTLPGPPAPSSTSAAIAAACGAAADVPQNLENPGVAVVTQEAAARSGLLRSLPPVDVKFPAVIAVPSGSKNIRRGPSELDVRTDSVPLKMPPVPPAVRTLTWPIPKAFSAAAWP